MKEKKMSKLDIVKSKICSNPKVVALGTGIGTTLISTNAFAADESITTSMQTALTSVKTDALSAISIIAPIALAIFWCCFRMEYW